ncbi:hypothetical protein HL670_03905 [Serratia plymuthica]|uniref:hypothetical protein n=1 Tax=Serratia plymuthica TaxID=82996 RepID=UPI0003498C7B|nr:hypothetical protein [Serratia plymuthica]QJW57008.1 hypothetical protein HL670_03905 [Serratia plymuthica]
MAQRYNTGNPRPSNSMKDLNDNALAYDDFLNSDEEEAVDRLQRPFPTVRKQVSARINEIIGAQQDAEVYAKEAKQSADNAQNIADANTYHITPADPDGTIAGIAGTPNGQFFRVMQGGDNGYKYFRNNNGVAVQESAIAGEAAIAAIQATQIFLSAMTPENLTNATPDWLHAWVDNNKKMIGGFDLSGGLNLCGMPDAVQDRLKFLADYLTTIKMPGYHGVLLDSQGKTGYAVKDDWGLWLAGLEKPVQDEINDLKEGGGSALLRPYNGLLAVFKDSVSATPVYAVNPVAYASKLKNGGASIVYESAGVMTSGTINLLEHPDYTVAPNNWVQRPIPLHVSTVLYRMGLGQSLMVGGGSRVTNIDMNLLGLALVFFGAGGDRGVGLDGFGEGPVTDENLGVFKDAESIGIFRENCMVPGLQRFLNDLMSVYSIQKSDLPAVVTRMDAKSGTAYSGLKKGTPVYNDGITAFTVFVERVIAQGKIPKAHSIIISHGENDSLIVTGLGQYKGNVNEWINDEQADQLAILASHGITQTEKPSALIDQLGSIDKTSNNRGDLIAYDQLDLCIERPDASLTVNKTILNIAYPMDDSAGQVHLSGMGYAILGEYQGQAEAYNYNKKENGSTDKFDAPYIIFIARDGKNLKAKYKVCIGSEIKVNSRFGARDDCGYFLENASANIIRVESSGSDTLTFVFDQAPASGDYLCAGYTSAEFKYPLITVSDSSTVRSVSDPTFVMENFAARQRLKIN